MEIPKVTNIDRSKLVTLDAPPQTTPLGWLYEREGRKGPHFYVREPVVGKANSKEYIIELIASEEGTTRYVVYPNVYGTRMGFVSSSLDECVAWPDLWESTEEFSVWLDTLPTFKEHKQVVKILAMEIARSDDDDDDDDDDDLPTTH